MLKTRGKHAALWQKARREFVKNNPDAWCTFCGRPATDVDHIQKRSTQPHLRYVQSNLQWICRNCHMKKDQ